MPYRQLTRDEIIQLGREAEDMARWEGARDYVSALYGLERHGHTHGPPHQLTIALITVPTMRQEYTETAEMVVTDVERHPLAFDLSRYWWSRFALSADEIATLQENTRGRLEDIRTLHDGAVYLALRDLCGELLGLTFRENVGPQTPVTFTYILDTPPATPIPAVYVME